jgi:hypothetical protein
MCTFFKVKGTSDVGAVDVFETLAGECVFDGQLHFPRRDDARHHILHPALHNVAQMQTPVDNVQAIFVQDERRRVVEEGDLDVSSW